MKASKETKEKITKLQLMEQNLQNIVLQKQTFQSQLLEIDNALTELDKTKGQSYKIIGGVMISAEKESLKKELNSKKDIANLRIKNIEKQENKLREEASELQKEVMKELKK